VSRRFAALALIASVATGCTVRYTGAARPVDAASIDPAQGWVVASVEPVRQVAENDCGPAALAMVAARWDHRVTLDELTLASAPSPEGTRLGTLRDAARAHGLRAFVLTGDRALLEHELTAGRPIVVGLVRPHGKKVKTHFEVVVGLHPDGRVATVDPASGWQVRPWAGLEAEWGAAGHPAMVVVGTTTTPVAPDLTAN